MINVYCNGCCIEEKKYVLKYILTERLGIYTNIYLKNHYESFELHLPNGATIELSGSFWNIYYKNNTSKQLLPIPNFINNRFAPEENVVLLYGNDFFLELKNKIVLGMDLFGGCFFMLSRLEEVIISKRDEHDRFSAAFSTAFKYGFLERPVVDEYIELLWNLISHLDKSLVRKKEAFRKFITSDLDFPYDPNRRSIVLTLFKIAGDLFKRKQIYQAFLTLFNYIGHQLRLNLKDPFREATSWIMDENEKAGNTVAFYFIPISTSRKDVTFGMECPEMQTLVNEINERGHEIGVHPGYNCYQNSEKFKSSVDSFTKALKKAGIEPTYIGGRMHYLRWDTLVCPLLWTSNNLVYDSTLGFADRSGFRCGTSHPFPMFDLIGKRQLELIERPLINMDCTVMAKRYENLGCSNTAKLRFYEFLKIVKRYKGEYVLLWHNSHLLLNHEKQIYSSLIQWE